MFCLYFQLTAQEGRSGRIVVLPVLSHVATTPQILAAQNSVCRDVSVLRELSCMKTNASPYQIAQAISVCTLI